MLKEQLECLQRVCPVVHCITNEVTVNDCANVLLACGASPVMAAAPEEAAEITTGCDGLVLNLGMLSPQKVTAMLRAGKRANELGHPVVLDPVGVGASAFRRESVQKLLEEIRFAVIRCNASELKSLALGSGGRGVDVLPHDRVTADTLSNTVALARVFAKAQAAVLAVTGETDLVTDGSTCWRIANGHPMMSRMTGTGCQLSAVTGAFVGANPTQPLAAAASAVCMMGLCGELAHERMTAQDGTGSYRVYLMDAVSRLTPEQLERGARYEF